MWVGALANAVAHDGYRRVKTLAIAGLRPGLPTLRSSRARIRWAGPSIPPGGQRVFDDVGCRTYLETAPGRPQSAALARRHRRAVDDAGAGLMLARFPAHRRARFLLHLGDFAVARLAGVNVPSEKRVDFALTHIYGVGRTTARRIREQAGLSEEKRVRDLTEAELGRVREIVDRMPMIEGSLRREKAMQIKRLMDLGCYRGLRHRRGLPVNGQRTHTNARTRKGRARPVTGKKKA